MCAIGLLLKWFDTGKVSGLIFLKRLRDRVLQSGNVKSFHRTQRVIRFFLFFWHKHKPPPLQKNPFSSILNMFWFIQCFDGTSIISGKVDYLDSFSPINNIYHSLFPILSAKRLKITD